MGLKCCPAGAKDGASCLTTDWRKGAAIASIPLAGSFGLNERGSYQAHRSQPFVCGKFACWVSCRENSSFQHNHFPGGLPLFSAHELLKLLSKINPDVETRRSLNSSSKQTSLTKTGDFCVVHISHNSLICIEM
jgi:hypothetical protein